MKRILVANRGEIAVRVMRTAHEMGYETVAVYSEPDASAPHVRMATYSVALGGQSASGSYLDVGKILDACERSGADAVHPGYGFLSERASFAEALIARGLTFIGPPASAIEAMGSKSESKRLMEAAGVPCVPGYHGDTQSEARFVEEAARIGYPIMVKASAGGGGKGMRLVHDPEALPEALRAASSEALNAFGDGKLLLERAIVAPRHIEVQVFADMHGHVIHLGERDCSVQRRHQKVIEEAPGVGVSEALRAKMGEAAVAAARSINYVGAGTVEFLLLPDGETFYFLEMNTRLQVEHPVTEMITGQDLVKWQLLVARGEQLPCVQEDVIWRGHAMEVRVYAEDPYEGFLPQSGVLRAWEPAPMTSLRVDSGVESGQEISSFYDPMLAKFIVWGEDRGAARRGLVRALKQSVVLGTWTNASFLLACLEHEQFVRGGCSTAFINDAFGELQHPELTPSQWAMSAAIWATSSAQEHARLWGGHRGWSSTGERRDLMRLEAREARCDVEVVWGRDGVREVVVCEGDEREVHPLQVKHRAGHKWALTLDGVSHEIAAVWGESTLWMSDGGVVWCVGDVYQRSASSDQIADGIIRAPMSGKVLSVRVKSGEQVEQGDMLLVLEAMKMEHELVAPGDGVVSEVHVSQGDQVSGESVLIELELE